MVKSLKSGVLIAIALLFAGCGDDKGAAKVAYVAGEADFEPAQSHVRLTWPGGFGSEVGERNTVLVIFSEPLASAYAGAGFAMESGQDLLDLVKEEIHIVAADDTVIEAVANLGPVTDDFLAATEVILTPAAPLTSGAEYHLRLSGEMQRFFGGLSASNTAFRVQPYESGAPISVANVHPLDSSLPLPDFATLRVTFNRAPSIDTLRYGESVQLQNQDDARLVSARILVQDRMLVIDPLEALLPGVSYELILKDIADSEGDLLAEYRRTFFTVSTMRRQRQLQIIGMRSGEECGEQGSEKAYYRENCINFSSALLGEVNATLQESSLAVELASVSGFQDVLPFRMMKGEVMQTSSIPITLHGIPVGAGNGEVMETGPLTLTLLGDALGYLLPNRFNRNAPYEFRLYLDLAVTAQNPAAAPLINQQILGVEVAGLIRIDPGSSISELDHLSMFGVSAVPLNLAGLETVHATMRFSGEAQLNQTWNPTRQESDTVPVSLVNVSPPLSEPLRPGVPLMLDFSEPLDSALLPEDLYLTNAASGAAIAAGFSTEVKGSRLMVRRNEVIQGRTENLHLGYDIKDIAGNPLDRDHDLVLSMPFTGSSPVRRMLPTYTYPGYPCVKTGSRDSVQQGRCEGGTYPEIQGPSAPELQTLPVQTLPANESIKAAFTQPVDPESVKAGFLVSKDDGESVPGTFKVQSNRVAFMPDAPWEEGVLYRYTLTSTLKSLDGGSLATLVLESDADGRFASSSQAAPSLTNHFYGGPASGRVPVGFEIWPTADINGDLAIRGSELPPTTQRSTGTVKLRIPPDIHAGRGVSGEAVANDGDPGVDLGIGIYKANIGCGFDINHDLPFYDVSRYRQLDCPDARIFSLVGSMLAYIESYDVADESVRLRVVPGILYSTDMPAVYTVHREICNIGHKNFEGCSTDYVNAVRAGVAVMQVQYGADGSDPVATIRKAPNGDARISTNISMRMGFPEIDYSDVKDSCDGDLINDLNAKEIDVMLSGKVEIDENGRMMAILSNQNKVGLDIRVWSRNKCEKWLMLIPLIPVPIQMSAYFDIHVEIPAGGMNINMLVPNHQ